MQNGLLFVTVLTVMLASCRELPQTEPTLEYASALMCERPDSALKLLQSVDKSSLRHRKARARYGLLYSQALDKTGGAVLSDSVIRPAVDYYSGRGNPEERALSYFYLGRVYQNLDSLPAAVEYMLKAKDVTDRLGDGREDKSTKALIMSNLAYLYYRQRSYDEAIELYEQARTVYKETESLKNLYITVTALSNCYAFVKESDKSHAMCLEAYEVALRMKDTAEILKMSSSVVSLEYDKNNDVVSAKRKLFENYARYNHGEVPVSDYSVLSLIYSDEGRYDSAGYYMRKALDKGKAYYKNRMSSLYYGLAYIDMRAGNYRQASDYLMRVIELERGKYAEDKANLIQELEEKYDNEQLRQTNYTLRIKSRYQAYLLLAALLAAVMTAAFATVKRRRYAEKVRREIGEMNAYVERVTEEYGHLQGSYEKLITDYSQKGQKEERLKNAMESRLASHKELLRIASMYGGSPKQFHAKINEYLKLEAQKDNAFYDILELVNAKYNGIIDYMRREYPSLDDDDLCLFGLICYGLSASEICMLYNFTNIDTIYNKRSVLRRKLGLDGSVRIERYIGSLAERMRVHGTIEDLPAVSDKGAA